MLQILLFKTWILKEFKFKSLNSHAIRILYGIDKEDKRNICEFNNAIIAKRTIVNFEFPVW